MRPDIPVPPEADNALRLIRERLTGSLMAVYLHGSAIAKGLRPLSDVDLIAVADRPIASGIRKSLAAGLMEISGLYPLAPEGRRPLEVIVFLRSDLVSASCPARAEFVYGEWLRREFEEGRPPQPVCDPEFTLLLAQARHEAVSLFGPGAEELLPDAPRSLIRRAIGEALPTLVAGLEGDERNVLLTLARMWRTLEKGDFVSKDTAGAWAASRLQTGQSRILAAARDAYLGLPEPCWQLRRKEVRQTAESLLENIATHLQPSS